jgi:hypothetical protein
MVRREDGALAWIEKNNQDGRSTFWLHLAPAAKHFVGDDAQEKNDADDGEFELGGEAEDVDGIVEEAQDGRADKGAKNTDFPTSQTAAAQHRGGDGVKFVKIPLPWWLDSIPIEGKQDAANSNDKGAEDISQNDEPMRADAAVASGFFVTPERLKMAAPNCLVEKERCDDTNEDHDECRGMNFIAAKQGNVRSRHAAQTIIVVPKSLSVIVSEPAGNTTVDEKSTKGHYKRLKPDLGNKESMGQANDR